MAEQPAVLERLVERFDAHVAQVRSIVPYPLDGIVFLARGSSDNAAVFGRYLAESAARRPAGLAAPSLYTLYGEEVRYEGYLAVALSQSGATPEIVSMCERMRAAGARTVGITNDPLSPLASVVEVNIPLDVGPEKAVVATKTVTAEFLAAAVVAAALGPVPFTAADLTLLPAAVSGVLEDTSSVGLVAKRWTGTDSMFVVARGLAYAAALETALKLKESAGVLAEAFSAADLRHGPIAAIAGGTSVLILDFGGPATTDIEDLIRVLRKRGASVVVCGTSAGAELPVTQGQPEALATIVGIVRAQQLALALARARGLDPDSPKGLSKVTLTH